MRVPDRFIDSLGAVLDPVVQGDIGVAVSGGSDSTSLLLCVREWARRRGRSVHAVTVDHGLRPESAQEAASVDEFCKILGVPHQTLEWRGWDGRGNLQAHARDARRKLISAWARERGIPTVALGHTIDDQAETFLMRLARGSGVDGLSAMPAVSVHSGVTWVRPLLKLNRDELRTFLRDSGVGWVNDPSNDDDGFERVRWRKALKELSRFGLDTNRLAATSEHMARARETLEASTDAFLNEHANCNAYGEVKLRSGVLETVTEDLRLRVVSTILRQASGQSYSPRFSALRRLLDEMASGENFSGASLHGCVVRREKSEFLFRREVSALSEDVPANIGCWDNRWAWRIGAVPDGASVGAITPDEITGIRKRIQDRVPREVLLTLPALRKDGRVIATPLTGMDNAVRFTLKVRQQGFNTMTIIR